MFLNKEQQKIFTQCKKTAGCWFIVKYIKDIEKKYNEFLDMTYKRNYAKKIYEESKRDCSIDNTIIRINCMLRLIRYNLVEYAYGYAINSNWY